MEHPYHEPLPDRSHRNLLSVLTIGLTVLDGTPFAPLAIGSALAIVVLNVATDNATAGNSFYGLAIGFTVMVGAFAVGPVSGGVFNPAVGTGPILVDSFAGDGSLASLWIYIGGAYPGRRGGRCGVRFTAPERRRSVVYGCAREGATPASY